MIGVCSKFAVLKEYNIRHHNETQHGEKHNMLQMRTVKRKKIDELLRLVSSPFSQGAKRSAMQQ